MPGKELPPEEGADLSGSTPESIAESRIILNEMNDVLAGLKQLAAEEEGPITFDVMERRADVFGAFSQQIAERVRDYRVYFYRGQHQGRAQHHPGEMSHAEAAVSDIYNGRRPGLEEFAQMQQAWDQAEQKEIPYIVWVAFDQKYVANYESGQGIFIELGGVNDGDFEEPVTAALQGQTVHAVELQTRLVETDEGHWYSVDGITFRIGDIS